MTSNRLTAKTCIACGAGFSGGSTAKYCPVCRAERIRKKDAERYQRKKAGKTRKLGTVDKCVLCGKRYIVNSAVQKYCTACAEADSKRRRHELWLTEYYTNPEKRRDYLQRARQWALQNKDKAIRIRKKHYRYNKEELRQQRRQRTGYKLRPVGRVEVCPKCKNEFTVTERNQRYCANCSKSIKKHREYSGILCANCNRPLPAGAHWLQKYCCAACKKEKNRAYAADRGQKCKEQKICRGCGRPAEPGKDFCLRCNVRKKDQYYISKDNKRCVLCGDTTANRGKTNAALCLRCADQAKKRQKERYAKLKEAGICVRCREKPAFVTLQGKRLVHCEECAKKLAEQDYARKNNKK